MLAGEITTLINNALLNSKINPLEMINKYILIL
jgi:hypothetical protein